MRKIFIIISLLIVSTLSYAQTITQYTDYTIITYPYYSLRADELTSTTCSIKCNSSPTAETSLNIPETVIINGVEHTVTEIANGGFDSKSMFVGSLILPNTIEYVRENAFKGCSGFTGHLILPANSHHEKFAWRWCSGFTSLTLSDGVICDDDKCFGPNNESMFSSVTTLYVLCNTNDIPNRIQSGLIDRLNGQAGSSVIYPGNMAEYVSPAKFNPAGGTYTESQTVTLTCETGGATIYYTTDGTTPSTNSTEYTGPITVENTTTIKAITVKSGLTDNHSQATYNIVRTVATPSLSKIGGSFYDEIDVEVDCATDGASIYYTTNGDDPLTGTLLEGGTIHIAQNTTLRVIATKDGWVNSSVVLEVFDFHTATPTITPGTSSIENNETFYVTLSCSTTDAKIYYTTNGTDPTTSSAVYSDPIAISTSTVIKAYASKTGWEDSQIATAIYTEKGIVQAPTFTPAGGTYTTSQTLNISCEAGATIYYTTDGSDPTTSATVKEYNGEISLDRNTTIRAYAYMDGMTNSSVISGTYNFNVQSPKFTPAPSGTYNQNQEITISCDTEGAYVHYTTDGINYTTINGSETITISQTTNIKAYATKDGWNNSNVADYTYTYKVETPTSEIHSNGFINGQFENTATIELDCDTDNATIYYTIDGTVPTTSSNTYTEAINIDATTNIRAIAVKENWDNSDMLDIYYMEAVTVVEPTFNPDNNQTFTEAFDLKITCETSGATLYYTTDGTEPTDEGTGYTSPININLNKTTTIKIFGAKSGIFPSPVITKTFTFKVPAPSIEITDETANSKTISISCTNADKIYYTIDGSDPTISDTRVEYIGNNTTVTLYENTTVIAYSTKEGWDDSDISEAQYEFNVTAPTFNPEGQEFEGNETLNVTLSCTPSDAIIYYTTDGNEPNISSPTIENGSSIEITQTTTVKAYAHKDGWNDSPITTANYIKKGVVQAPILSLTPGSYHETKTTTVSCATAGATIYYTTDSNEPNIPIENGSDIEITQSTTIKAIACKDGMTPSPVITESYILEVLPPTFNLAEGTYEETQYLNLNCETDGATIYYTTDGTDPDKTSTPFDGNKIIIDKTQIVKAIAYKNGWEPSHISNMSYTIMGTVATPEFNYPSGEYTKSIDVVITCSTPDATIRYTTDGSTPDNHNTIYNEPITVNTTTTIRAIAFKNGMKTSDEVLATYIFGGGTYNSNNLIVFTGNDATSPNSWYNPNNWSSNSIPSTTAEVAIVGNLIISSNERIVVSFITNMASATNYNKAGTITIEDGGQLIYTNATIENVKIEKEITGYGENTNSNGWYLISSPVAGPISNERYQSLINNDNTFYDLYLYNESDHHWHNYKENGNFTNLFLGQGYLYANRNDVTITSVGIPNTNDVNFVLSAASSITQHGTDMIGFNLIGNPFTFNIGKGNGQAIPNTYLEEGYYTLSPEDGTWSVASDSRPIGVGEAILVETAGNSNNGAILTISKTPFTAQSNARGASEDVESLSIKVANADYEDIAYVNFNNKERGLRKIAHMNEDAQMVYVPVDGVNYAIANMSTDVKEIPVSLEAYTMGKYTISIDASDCNFEEIYLRDNFTGEIVDIINGDYTFVATSSDEAERFTLMIINNNDDNSDIINQNFAYISNGEIIINDIEGSGNVQIFDVMGRMLVTRDVNGSANISTETLTNGIYIISLIDDNGIKTQKIAINK